MLCASVKLSAFELTLPMDLRQSFLGEDALAIVLRDTAEQLR
jgi:hypothetical protein